MQTSSTIPSASVSVPSAITAEPTPPAPVEPQIVPVAPAAPQAETPEQPAGSVRSYREPPLIKDKHVYCVVSRLLTNNIYVSGGYERPHLATQQPTMVVVIGDTRYCIHFRSLKGGFPEYLQDQNLMTIAQDSAEKLIIRRFGNGHSQPK